MDPGEVMEKLETISTTASIYTEEYPTRMAAV
jgi:hypothetical protein